MNVKNIKSIILLIILSIHVYVLKTHGDTKMTTCCCGSCREGGNQENNSISSNPNLLQKSKITPNKTNYFHLKIERLYASGCEICKKKCKNGKSTKALKKVERGYQTAIRQRMTTIRQHIIAM